MSSRFPENVRLACVLALLACFSRVEARDLVVCADPDNLPFSRQDGSGFENRIAAVVAQDLRARLVYHWLPLRRGVVRKTLDARLCDVLMGVPADPTGVATTIPYYRSSYAIVTRTTWGAPVASLDDRRLRASRIGVPLIGADGAIVPPASALVRGGNIDNVQGFPVYGALPVAQRLVDALAADKLDIAVGWGPAVAYYARRAKVPVDIALVPGETSAPASFAIAIAVRADAGALRDDLNGALDRTRPRIDAVLAAYSVPLLPLHRPTGAQQ